MKNILLTGSSGFIGREFSKSYSKEYNIIELDLPSFDITSETGYKKLDNYNNIDAIIHLAALSNPKESFQNPKKYYDVNLYGTLNLLNFAKDNNVNNFFFMSSLTVHGSSDNILNENSKISPKHIYGATKAATEILCETYSKEYGININILRPNLIIGVNKKPPDLIQMLVEEVTKKSEITIFGDGEHIRDFVHVNDVCKIINSLINYNQGFQTFCLGGNPYSIIKLSNIISKNYRKIRKIYKPKNSSSFSLFCSNNKLKEEISFDINIQIDQMINESFATYE